MKNHKATIFRPSTIDNVGTFILVGIITFAYYIFIFEGRESTTIKVLASLLFVAATIFFLWRLNTFYVDQQRLLIRKKFLFIKHSFAWTDIKSIMIDVRHTVITKTPYEVLSIITSSNRTKTFRLPLNYDKRQLFIKCIEEQGVGIINFSK